MGGFCSLAGSARILFALANEYTPQSNATGNHTLLEIAQILLGKFNSSC
jgi:hypothetical protein